MAKKTIHYCDVCGAQMTDQAGNICGIQQWTAVKELGGGTCYDWKERQGRAEFYIIVSEHEVLTGDRAVNTCLDKRIHYPDGPDNDRRLFCSLSCFDIWLDKLRDKIRAAWAACAADVAREHAAAVDIIRKRAAPPPPPPDDEDHDKGGVPR